MRETHHPQESEGVPPITEIDPRNPYEKKKIIVRFPDGTTAEAANEDEARRMRQDFHDNK